MGLLIDSDLGGDPAAFTSRFSAARGTALGRLTAARVAAMDNLPYVNGKNSCTKFVCSGRVDIAFGASGAWGSWQEMIPAASRDFTTAILAIGIPRVTYQGAKLQVGAGASGSETVEVSDLICEPNWKGFLVLAVNIPLTVPSPQPGNPAVPKQRLAMRGTTGSSSVRRAEAVLLAGG